MSSKRKYVHRADLNLVDQARFDRLARVQQVMGETSASATVRRLIDEEAARRGVYDAAAPAEDPQAMRQLAQLRDVLTGRARGDAGALLRQLLQQPAKGRG